MLDPKSVRFFFSHQHHHALAMGSQRLNLQPHRGIPNDSDFAQLKNWGWETQMFLPFQPASVVRLVPSHMLITTHMGFISPRACPSKPPKPPCFSPSALSCQPP